MTRVLRDTFRTYTGRTVSITEPTADDVCFEDIARALSRVQRFGGHCHKPYSVAEHSVLVSYLCHPRHALLGLLHDASEAYAGDVITPLKRCLTDYKAIEQNWMLAIGQACGLGDALTCLPADVHLADGVALQTERRDVFSPSRVDPAGLPPSEAFAVMGLEADEAYDCFVHRFEELTGVDPRG